MTALTELEFLEARIAEDADRGKRAAFGWGSEWRDVTDEADEWSTVHAEGKLDMVGCEDGDVTRHIARWDPARVLTECAAKWRVVALLDAAWDAGGGYDEEALLARDVVRAMVQPFADHPDFDSAWRL